MAKCLEPFVGRVGNESHGGAGSELSVQIAFLAIDGGNQRGLGKTRTDIGRQVIGGGACGKLSLGPVRKLNNNT